MDRAQNSRFRAKVEEFCRWLERAGFWLAGLSRSLKSQPSVCLRAGYVPTLEFTSSSNNLVLSWPSAAEGFVLETTGQLSPTTTWTPVASPPEVAGDQSVFTIPLSNRSGFYRL